MISGAEGVIAKNLDDAAIRNAASGAVHEHPLEFRFQGGQAGKAAFDLGQLRLGDGIDGGTGLVGPVR